MRAPIFVSNLLGFAAVAKNLRFSPDITKEKTLGKVIVSIIAEISILHLAIDLEETSKWSKTVVDEKTETLERNFLK